MKKEIISEIEEALKKLAGTGLEVKFPKVLKNNDSVRHTVVLREPGSAVSPTIYIDGMLEIIEIGKKDAHDVAQEILDIYRSTDAGAFSGILDKLNKKIILENVVYQIINTGRNKERLKKLPHREFLDLSAVYRFIPDEGEGAFSICITHGLCDAYGISESELEHSAWQNTKAKGFCVMGMAEIISDILGLPDEAIPDVPSDYTPMYVLTNRTKINGSAVMLYREVFRGLAEKLQSDLYVMPSSIHEVIAVPAEGLEPNSLRSMVADVNSSEVSEEDFLGGNVYKYSREAGELSIV